MLDKDGAVITGNKVTGDGGRQCTPKGLVGVLYIVLGVSGNSETIEGVFLEAGDPVMDMERVRTMPPD